MARKRITHPRWARFFIDVGKVTDTMQIASYGVFGTPAVVVDGKVKSVGKIPTKEEINDFVEKLLEALDAQS
jgi:hypothetical protein